MPPSLRAARLLVLLVGLLGRTALATGSSAAQHFSLTLTRQMGYTPQAPLKAQLLVNGTWPGPEIRVAPSTLVSITVWNLMHAEGAAVHWHGMFQQGTPWADGVVGITQARLHLASPSYKRLSFSPLLSRRSARSRQAAT